MSKNKMPPAVATTEEITEDAMATIVITTNLKTGDIRIAGNILADENLALRLLIEAAHRVMTSKPQPLQNGPLKVA